MIGQYCAVSEAHICSLCVSIALPFPVQVINNLGWLMFAISINDIYIFISNAPALVLGLYFVLHSFRLATQRTADIIFYILGTGVASSIILCALAGYGAFTTQSQSLTLTQTIFGNIENRALYIYIYIYIYI